MLPAATFCAAGGLMGEKIAWRGDGRPNAAYLFLGQQSAPHIPTAPQQRLPSTQQVPLQQNRVKSGPQPALLGRIVQAVVLTLVSHHSQSRSGLIVPLA